MNLDQIVLDVELKTNNFEIVIYKCLNLFYVRMVLKKEQLKELKAASNGIKPEFVIGKNGISPGLIEGLDKYMEAHGLVKVKCRIATNKDELQYYIDKVIEGNDFILIDVKGYTFTLFKEN